MTQPAVPAEQPRRGSCLGADGIYYPAWEEREVPLSDWALRLIMYLYLALNHVFARRPDVYVGGDQFFYWEPGDTGKRVAPDVYVVFGVPKLPFRDVWRVWEEAPPRFVVEVSSKASRELDRGAKRILYRDVLQVPEYLIYDQETREFILLRLEEGEYAEQQPDREGRLYSAELGVSFGPDPDLDVRVYSSSGEPVPWTMELFEQREELRDHRDMLARIAKRLEADVERERRRADEQARIATEQARIAAEHARIAAERQQRVEEQQRELEAERARADALAAELERLRGKQATEQ